MEFEITLTILLYYMTYRYTFTNYKVFIKRLEKKREKTYLHKLKPLNFFYKNHIDNEFITTLSNYANGQVYNRVLFIFKSILMYV